MLVTSDVLFVYLFQENKSYGSKKNHLHSSSGVQEKRVGHRNKITLGGQNKKRVKGGK
jgi:hypothetical protein